MVNLTLFRRGGIRRFVGEAHRNAPAKATQLRKLRIGLIGWIFGNAVVERLLLPLINKADAEHAVGATQEVGVGHVVAHSRTNEINVVVGVRLVLN